MNITRLVKDYLKENNWPEKEVRIGPATCGAKGCLMMHAYARTVQTSCQMKDCKHPEGHGYVWFYQRPCVQDDAGVEQRLKEQYGKRFFLN